jgi:large subunit ribosomal protein L15
MELHKVLAVSKNRKKVRVGRGSGSGLGKTSGRGHNGAGQRTGFGGLLHREGGQMPLIRRIPKRGFRNTMFRAAFDVVNVDRLEEFAGQKITPEFLAEKGVTANRWGRVKVLGGGDVKSALDVTAHAFSGSAKDKIEKAGGTATLVDAGVLPREKTGATARSKARAKARAETAGKA